MAMDDDAVILSALGFILTAERGTAAPTKTEIAAIPDSIPTSWNNIGHTSRDDLPSWGHDGGDPEVKGTWQNEALRSVVTEVATEFVTFNAVQLSREILEFYTGRGNGAATDGTIEEGVYHASLRGGRNPERALLIVVIDGDRWGAFYAPRVSLSREDDIELDSEEFMAFPLRATLLQQTGMPFYDWIGPTIDGEGSTPDQVSSTVEQAA